MTSSELQDAEPASQTAPAPAPAETAVTREGEGRKSHKFRRRRLFRIGLQSKLLLTLLVCSILSIGVIAFIGASSGRNALREVESERLIELRESQARQVQALFKEVTNSMIVYSGGFSIVEATTAFSDGFAQLSNA
ncbi:MAG: adenylate/guanylate cyclase domain-containing protein, partial [Mycobacterium sp.]